MLAVIKTGGKQYKVSENSVIKVEKLEGNAGDNIDFNEVLLVSDEKGSDVKVGKPLVPGAVVKAVIKSQGRGKKIDVIKFKNKTRYTRKQGHRQAYTEVQINSITA